MSTRENKRTIARASLICQSSADEIIVRLCVQRTEIGQIGTGEADRLDA